MAADLQVRRFRTSEGHPCPLFVRGIRVFLVSDLRPVAERPRRSSQVPYLGGYRATDRLKPLVAIVVCREDTWRDAGLGHSVPAAAAVLRVKSGYQVARGNTGAHPLAGLPSGPAACRACQRAMHDLGSVLDLGSTPGGCRPAPDSPRLQPRSTCRSPLRRAGGLGIPAGPRGPPPGHAVQGGGQQGDAESRAAHCRRALCPPAPWPG